MPNNNLHTLKNFVVVGISYQKADAEIRGHFSLPHEKQLQLLEGAKTAGVESLCVISTCNRTELYGFIETTNELIELLCAYTHGTQEEFEQVGYFLENKAAISHLFQVGTGLDSQILGDFEIISQLRKCFRTSKEMGLLNGYMERLANEVIKASKRIKNETTISSGATSVSFAAVQYILSRVPYVSEKNILLFGVGKIGRNTCENLIKHTQNKHITLINRTKFKAEEIAGKFQLNVVEYKAIQEEISKTDILVVATGAQQPTITKELLYVKKPLLILDLSIPKNVHQNVSENPLVTLVHLDELSKLTQQTLSDRQEQLPLAKKIINEIEADFIEWARQRSFAPTIQALKLKLSGIKSGELNFQSKKVTDFNEAHADLLADRLIQKITTQVVNHLKNANGSTEQSLEMIQKMFELEKA